jgi:uncharacterized protein (TIGR02466 family)
MIIQKVFPTLIGFSDYKDHNQIESKLVDKCYSLKEKTLSGGSAWVSNKTYNTSYTYNIFNDEDFKQLNDWVSEQIKEYANQLNYINEFICDNAWFNIYKKYDYQEVHEHSPNTLSAIYILKANKDTCAKTFFYSNIIDGLEPQGTLNVDTSSTISCNPIPGRLIIFRSNVKHCVERQETDDERISLAYNFKIKQ